MIGIIGAMGVEVESLKEKLENPVPQTISGIEFVRGRMYGSNVVVATCGIGKVFAALCAEIMILRYSPDIIINTGVAGTLTENLSIGDIAIATDVVQHDMDTTAIGDPPGLISGINVVNIKCDTKIVNLLEKSAADEKIHTFKGTIASGDQFVSTPDVKQRIVGLFNGIACEMEGAAIGQVCYVNRVPFAVIRAISDNANGESCNDYPTFVKKAAEDSVKVLKHVIKVL